MSEKAVIEISLWCSLHILMGKKCELFHSLVFEKFDDGGQGILTIYGIVLSLMFCFHADVAQW